jgi:predicted nucleotidyltransferase
MKEAIKKICQQIEEEKGIRILFAVENGSRAWRMDSKDSDYDVRFVFVRPLREYIQINRPGEVIEAAFDKDLRPCAVEGSVVDLSGFDVFKYVKMLSSSNPTTIEWLMSDIVYYGEQNPVFKRFAIDNFSKISLYHHYKSMCRNNYLKYLKSGDLVTYKKYLYAYRGLVNAKWVVHKGTVPPIVFGDALAEMKGVLPDNVLNKLHEIIRLKAEGKEKDIIQNIVVMDNYIEEFLKDDSEAPKEKSHATLHELNEELRKIVL